MTDDSRNNQTPPSLLLRLRNPADAAAWALFTETYTPLVYGHCRRQGLQESDAADVAQEVMLQVSRSIGRFEYEPGRGRFRNWLGVVVRSKISRWRRSAARLPAVDDIALDVATAPEADPEWTAAFHARLLQVAMERVRPDYDPRNWRAFEGVWVENRPVAEVAAELGIAPSAVYLARSRVLARLRNEVLTLADDVPYLTHSE